MADVRSEKVEVEAEAEVKQMTEDGRRETEDQGLGTKDQEPRTRRGYPQITQTTRSVAPLVPTVRCAPPMEGSRPGRAEVRSADDGRRTAMRTRGTDRSAEASGRRATSRRA